MTKEPKIDTTEEEDWGYFERLEADIIGGVL